MRVCIDPVVGLASHTARSALVDQSWAVGGGGAATRPPPPSPPGPAKAARGGEEEGGGDKWGHTPRGQVPPVGGSAAAVGAHMHTPPHAHTPTPAPAGPRGHPHPPRRRPAGCVGGRRDACFLRALDRPVCRALRIHLPRGDPRRRRRRRGLLHLPAPAAGRGRQAARPGCGRLRRHLCAHAGTRRTGRPQGPMAGAGRRHAVCRRRRLPPDGHAARQPGLPPPRHCRQGPRDCGAHRPRGAPLAAHDAALLRAGARDAPRPAGARLGAGRRALDCPQCGQACAQGAHGHVLGHAGPRGPRDVRAAHPRPRRARRRAGVGGGLRHPPERGVFHQGGPERLPGGGALPPPPPPGPRGRAPARGRARDDAALGRLGEPALHPLRRAAPHCGRRRLRGRAPRVCTRGCSQLCEACDGVHCGIYYRGVCLARDRLTTRSGFQRRRTTPTS